MLGWPGTTKFDMRVLASERESINGKKTTFYSGETFHLLINRDDVCYG